VLFLLGNGNGTLNQQPFTDRVVSVRLPSQPEMSTATGTATSASQIA
jgi:hypothetical protein